SLIWDGAHELELPRRMLDGERLYTDLRFYYGPLAPSLNAALYRLFGVHLDVLMAAGIVSAGPPALAPQPHRPQFLASLALGCPGGCVLRAVRVRPAVPEPELQLRLPLHLRRDLRDGRRALVAGLPPSRVAPR